MALIDGCGTGSFYDSLGCQRELQNGARIKVSHPVAFPSLPNDIFFDISAASHHPLPLVNFLGTSLILLYVDFPATLLLSPLNCWLSTF